MVPFKLLYNYAYSRRFHLLLLFLLKDSSLKDMSLRLKNKSVDYNFMDLALDNSKDLKMPLKLDAYQKLLFFLVKNK